MPDLVVFSVLTDGPVQIVPEVNGRSLVDLVTEFEESRSFTPAGGYAGLVPAHFTFGDLARYYLGEEPEQWPKPGHLWLLGCECGEVGCWPLEARVTATDETVAWSNFHTPQRAGRDYTGFGPFLFARDHYDLAVRRAIRRGEW